MRRCPYLGRITAKDEATFCRYCSNQQKTLCSPRLRWVIGLAWLFLCVSLVGYLLTDKLFFLIIAAGEVVLILGDALFRKLMN